MRGLRRLQVRPAWTLRLKTFTDYSLRRRRRAGRMFRFGGRPLRLEMSGAGGFTFSGDAASWPLITRALHRVIDPEMALDVVELVLVYGVQADGGAVRVRITMTSAACPVSEFIVDEVAREIRRELGEATPVHVDLVWDPPWGPERLSDRARAVLDWD